MAEALLQVLLDNLVSHVNDEIGLIMGVDDEIKKLASTLTTIQAVLADAEDKQFESEAIRNWLCKLKNLIYEIEDVLDECATEVSILKHKNSKLNRYSLKKLLNRHKIGRRVKEVTEKLDAVAAERQKFHLNVMVVERQSKAATTRETCSILNEPDLVFGREEEMEKIVDILVNQVRDSQQLSILPILGIGGLGKTTLAQMVFNDSRVTEHFDTKLWICVSDNFEIKILVKAMLASAATGSERTSDHLDTLQHHSQELKKLLNQKRYLLIFDDVWNEDQEEWAKLKSVLECGARGASIVVTTRLGTVANIVRTLPAHDLTKLSEEHCWLLFKQRAFGQEVEQHPNLEAIGKQIVKKCGGVPLAAKALGGLLRFKSEEKEWVHVNQSEIWNLQSSILPALRLSYQHLPLHLRQCFAYCAIYPKDEIIEKEELIFCWMAHGYISSKGRMDVEDVGNEVWNELVLRSLFQDIGTFYKGSITCKIHDLVHDLAQSIMENKVPGAQVESSDQSVMDRNKIRQVDVQKGYVAFPTSFQEEVNMSYTFKTFNRLRMLDASWCDHVELPSKIGSLKHLRYVNLSYSNKLRTLPDTICSLWNLQILNLNRCTRLVSLPKGMRYMKNLRHLYLEWCRSLREMPPKIGELSTSLKTLSLFIVGDVIDTQLDQLQHLNLGGRLEMRHLERVKNYLDGKRANLGQKSNLRELVLQWQGGDASEHQQEINEKVLEALEPHSNLETLRIDGFRGRCFPPWLRMENIIKINIEDCPNCSHLPPLGDLPRLKKLKLHKLAALEYVMKNEALQVVDHEVENEAKILFPSLEKLELKDLPNLKGLLKEEEDEVGEIIFPKLQNLYVEGCPMLKLPALSSLKELTASRCNNLNLNSFSKLGNLTSLTVQFDDDKGTCITKETLGNLSSLKKLVLINAQEHNLPIIEVGNQCLKTLKKLKIWDCDTLRCLPDGWFQHLIALEKLYIYSCSELVELLPAEGMTYLNSSLTHLTLHRLPKMVRLPEALRHLSPSLQSLSLPNLPQLTSLPDWLGNFTSLQHLEICDCPRLTSLPASIKGMSNLNKLTISSLWGEEVNGEEVNGELKRRCEKGKGEDWHLISHIPNLIIEEGRY